MAKYYYKKFSIDKHIDLREITDFSKPYNNTLRVDYSQGLMAYFKVLVDDKGYAYGDPNSAMRLNGSSAYDRIANSRTPVAILDSNKISPDDSTSLRIYSNQSQVSNKTSCTLNFYGSIQPSKATFITEKGNFIERVGPVNKGTYPENGIHSDGYWYELGDKANCNPTISGKDGSDMIDRERPTYKYTVNDEDSSDRLTITETVYINMTTSKVINKRTGVSPGSTFTMAMSDEDYKNLNPGDEIFYHITVEDNAGGIAIRQFKWQKQPYIDIKLLSENDGRLTYNNMHHCIAYKIITNCNNPISNLRIDIKLESERVYSEENAKTDGIYHYIIPQEYWNIISIVGQSYYEVEAIVDGKNCTTVSSSFRRERNVDITSNSNNYGKISAPPSIKLNVDYDFDVSSFSLYVMVKNKEIAKIENPKLGKNTINISQEKWDSINPGENVFNIFIHQTKRNVYAPNLGEISINFVKFDPKCSVTLKHPISKETAMPKLIFLKPVIIKPDESEVEYEVCNNGFDEEPTWENCTECVESKKIYNFKNNEKQRDYWGILFRVTMNRGQSEKPIILSKITGYYK